MHRWDIRRVSFGQTAFFRYYHTTLTPGSGETKYVERNAHLQPHGGAFERDGDN